MLNSSQVGTSFAAYFGKAVIGAVTGAIVTLLIEVFFVLEDRLADVSEWRRRQFFIVLISGTLFGMMLACAFGHYHLKGAAKKVVAGTLFGTFAGIFVGGMLFPFLFCLRPDNPQVDFTRTKEWGALQLMGMMVGVPGGAILGLIGGMIYSWLTRHVIGVHLRQSAASSRAGKI